MIEYFLVCGIPLTLLLTYGVWRWFRDQEKRISELENERD